MRRFRFSIGGLMLIVVAAAVGLAALKNASPTWAGAMLLLTCAILALAIVGAIYRQGAERVWWLGFSIFGWGYMVLWWFLHDNTSFVLPTTGLLERLAPWLGVAPGMAGGGFGQVGAGMFSVAVFGGFGGGGGPAIDPYYAQAGQCLFALLAALLGGLLSVFFFASSSDRSDRPQAAEPEASQPPRSRWLRPTIIGLVVLIVAGAAATIWSGAKAPRWAGITFTLTCALVGIAILGAVAGRGHRRAIWLGAALFGAGYMILSFSRPPGHTPRAYFPTDQILEALREWLPPVPRGLSEENARILEALRRPIPMRFAVETPLDDVLKYIKQATTTPDYPGLPIYVDPIGLQEAERSLNSTVQIDLEGIRLNETLRLCLEQLGLTYEVKAGHLWITNEDDYPEPDLEDPFLIVGHCLLAIVAAGFGALAAPMVAGARREPPGQRAGPTGDARPT
jgi:hypothetical protein